MKRLIRLDEDDVRELVAMTYKVPIENVFTSITEEPSGPYEEMTPYFTVEIELKGDNK